MIAVSNVLPHPNPPLVKATVYTQVVSARVSGVIDPWNCHYERK